MPILELRSATFCDAEKAIPPVTIALDDGERADFLCDSGFAASIVARLASGIVKCTTGTVFIGGFDPKIQPVQAKRLVGFVSHERFRTRCDPSAYFAYRAALWEIEPSQAIARGQALLKRFDGLPIDQSMALAGALLHEPRLLVVDRPSQLLREAAEEAASAAALFAVYGPGEIPALRPPSELAVAEAMQ